MFSFTRLYLKTKRKFYVAKKSFGYFKRQPKKQIFLPVSTQLNDIKISSEENLGAKEKQLIIKSILDNFKPSKYPPLSIHIIGLKPYAKEVRLAKAGIFYFYNNVIEYYPFTMSYVELQTRKNDIYSLLKSVYANNHLSISGEDQQLCQLAGAYLQVLLNPVIKIEHYLNYRLHG